MLIQKKKKNTQGGNKLSSRSTNVNKINTLMGHTQHSNQPKEEPHHRITSLDAQCRVATSVIHTTVVYLELFFHKPFLVHLRGRNTNEVP